MKQPQVISKIFTAILIIVIMYVQLPWFCIYIGLMLSPNPPGPEITYGEFPFRLEYEINGKKVVVEDTLICEYDGIGMDEGRGKFRKWKDHLASGNERVTLLKVSDDLEIHYPVYNAKFYMGDSDYPDDHQAFPNASQIKKDEIGTLRGIVYADDLLEEYNIKLISWEIKKPIKNKFVE